MSTFGLQKLDLTEKIYIKVEGLPFITRQRTRMFLASISSPLVGSHYEYRLSNPLEDAPIENNKIYLHPYDPTSIVQNFIRRGRFVDYYTFTLSGRSARFYYLKTILTN